MIDYVESPDGSQRWCTQGDMLGAGMFTPEPEAIQLGYYDEGCEPQEFFVNSDASIALIGGAGSGKLTTQIAYNAVNVQLSMLCMDLKKEIYYISQRWRREALGQQIWAWCPSKTFEDGPSHSCNPLWNLTPESPTLDDDCKRIASDMIPVHPGENSHFDETAGAWCEVLMKWQVVSEGSTSLPRLFTLINMIDGQPDEFEKQAISMCRSDFEDIRRVGNQIMFTHHQAPKEYSGYMSSIFRELGCLSSRNLAASLSGDADFTLDVLCDPKQKATVYLCPPASMVRKWAAPLRVLIGQAMRAKERRPDVPPVWFLVDEAAQLSTFQTLMESVVYLRSAGVRVMHVWQSVSQIAAAFGPEAISTFLGSSQTRQFVGIRDLESAQMLERMLGMMTIDDPNYEWNREQARFAKRQAALDMLGGADPLVAAFKLGHYRRGECHRQTKPRLMMSAAEIISMPRDRMICLVADKDVYPIFGLKRNYWDTPHAHKFDANPYYARSR